MRLLYVNAACAALAALAAPSICAASDGAPDPNAAGGGSGPAATEPAAPPVEPKPPANETPAAEKTAAPKDGKRKAAKEAEPGEGGKVTIVWVAPGFAHSPGTLLNADAEVAENLRAVGRARRASDQEVKAAEAAGTEIPDFG